MIEWYEFASEADGGQARLLFPNTLNGLLKAKAVIDIELARLNHDEGQP